MSVIKRFLNWISPESTEQIEAEEENVAFDKTRVDEAFLEALKAARHMRKAADAFVVVGEIFVKDVKGQPHAKATSRVKKPQ